MRQDKLTNQFQQALAEAQSLALGRDHQHLEPVHLATALLEQRGGGSVGLLSKAGSALLWQTVPLLVIGAGMLVYSYRDNIKTIPAAFGNFFKSLVPPTLEENA